MIRGDRWWSIACLVGLALEMLLPATAIADEGKLLATGGASEFEGAAGGGIVPWAVLAGYGTDNQNDGTASATRVDTGDYALDAAGIAYTFRNRVEVSYTRQRFHLDTLQHDLSLPTGMFDAVVVGAKLRLGGDVVYTVMPQISLGIEYKRQLDFAIPQAIGARDDQGTDIYLTATKLFIAGLAGFEYRQKPNNLSFAREDNWKDAFLAWFPNKHLSLVGAYADLGSIATLDHQRGAYLSVQVAY